MNIIKLAKEAGFYVTDDDILMPEWNKLAALVSEAARAEALEEAAKVCDEMSERHFQSPFNCAAAIRSLK